MTSVQGGRVRRELGGREEAGIKRKVNGGQKRGKSGMRKGYMNELDTRRR